MARRNRETRRERVCSVIGAIAGMAVGLFTARSGTEGWDHPWYFPTVLPFTLVISLILGRFGPRLPWRHGGLLVATQLPWIGVGVKGPLAPLGMIFVVGLLLLHIGAAYAGRLFAPSRGPAA